MTIDNEPTSIYTASTLGDLAAAMPTLFGFMPEHSIVAIATHGPRRRMGFRLRVDLPDRPGLAEELGSLIAYHLDNQDAEGMILFGVGATHERELADEVLGHVIVKAHAEPIVSAWLDVEQGQVWDLLDTERAPETLPADHLSVVMAVAAGQTMLGTRAEVVATFATANGVPLFDKVAANIEALHNVGLPAPEAAEAALYALAAQDMVPGSIAVLATCVGHDIEIRDHVWGLVNMDNAQHMSTALHTAAVNVSAPELVAPLMGLAAFAYWQTGDGARALIAIDRSLEAVPDYSMARLLAHILELGAAPSTWTALREQQQG